MYLGDSIKSEQDFDTWVWKSLAELSDTQIASIPDEAKRALLQDQGVKKRKKKGPT